MQKNNTWPGVFITIEGTEGSGKSTVASLIQTYYEKQSRCVILTREPGGIPIAEKIRSIILDPDHVEMDARTEALLYAAARRQHLVEKIIPALQEGKIVICDRFVDSSLAYQGIGRGLGIEAVWALNQFAIEKCMPVCTLLFELDYQIGLMRIANNETREVNRLDLEKAQFHQSVSEGYDILKRKFPDRIHSIDAKQPVEQVLSDCIHILQPYIRKN